MTSKTFDTSVFISYAREDHETAKKLFHDLRDYGFDPWLDTEKLLPGQRWKPAIRRAIRQSTYFIALLSESSVGKKGFVQRELRQALEVLEELPDHEIFLIPARIEDCEPTFEQLIELNWVDLFPDYNQGLPKILNVLGRGEKSEFASTNLRPALPDHPEKEDLSLGAGMKYEQPQMTPESFYDTIWKQSIEDGNPAQTFVKFRSDGHFVYNHDHPKNFKYDGDDTWRITGRVLEVSWSGGYTIDVFPLPEEITEELHGTQSLGGRRITFSKIG